MTPDEGVFLGSKIRAGQKKVKRQALHCIIYISAGKKPGELRRGKWRSKVGIRVSWNQWVGFHSSVSPRADVNSCHVATLPVWIVFSFSKSQCQIQLCWKKCQRFYNSSPHFMYIYFFKIFSPWLWIFLNVSKGLWTSSQGLYQVEKITGIWNRKGLWNAVFKLSMWWNRNTQS